MAAWLGSLSKRLRCSSSPGIVLQPLHYVYFYSEKSLQAPLDSDSLSPCSQSSWAWSGERGVAVSSGGKSQRVEDWGVPGDGETVAGRTGEWAIVGTLDSSTFEEEMRLRYDPASPASGVSQAVPSSPNWTSDQRAEEQTLFFQIGVIEAATSPIKGRPQVRMQ